MSGDRNQVLVNSAIVALLAAIFVLELLTPLGFAGWIFYIVPVGLCLLQSRPALPLVVAGAGTLLVIAGYLYSPLGAEWALSFVNRTIGIATVWFVAFIARQNILTRMRLGRRARIEEGQALVNKAALGDFRPEEVAQAQLTALAEYLDAHVGALYRREGQTLLRVAAYAMPAPHCSLHCRPDSGHPCSW
jgi:hypothetical protein